MYLNSVPTFKNIMCYLVAKRIREKIRIVTDDLFYKQLRNFTSRQQIYEPNYVSSHKEAEEKLSRTPRCNGLRIYLRHNSAECLTGNAKGINRIIDISTSGCAFESGSVHPAVDEEILMMIALKKNRDASLEEFKIKARVVRSDNKMFAVRFMEFDDEQKDQLWNCLLCESELLI